MTATPLLLAQGIGISLSGREILKQVNFSLHAGEIMTLIGPNGAGKTTLVRIVLGLLQPDNGSIQNVARRIGYMPQRLSLSPNMPLTVKRFLALARKTGAADIAQAARELSIEHLLLQPMQYLSGGERQRVLLARALLAKPDLLVLDEPVQGVDVTGQAELYAMIQTIRDRHGCGVLMISHDLHLVMAATDQVLCLNQHVCCSGSPDSVSQHPAYLELFGHKGDASLAFYTHHHNHTHDIHGNVVKPQGDEHG